MVVMISVVFMVEQCTHMSGNNAISCEKFTDASSPRSTFIIIVITTRENPPKETCLFWHLLILSNLIECGDFNMPFLLLRIERKHNLTHTHISHWWYIWAWRTSSVFKYLVLSICVTKKTLKVASSTQHTHSINRKERHKYSFSVKFEFLKYLFEYGSRATSLPVPIFCCKVHFFHRRINLFSLDPNFFNLFSLVLNLFHSNISLTKIKIFLSQK